MTKATPALARSLRRRASSAERDLWRLLRGRGLEGFKFRRQFPIGRYVADFVCLRHRVIVEADGPFHDAEHDAARDAWLQTQGFTVLRFSTSEVASGSHKVEMRILAALRGPPPIGEV